jgi:hypothetical protein
MSLKYRSKRITNKKISMYEDLKKTFILVEFEPESSVPEADEMKAAPHRMGL